MKKIKTFFLNKDKIKEFTSILPFNKVISLIGAFFTICSIIYVVIFHAILRFDVLEKYKTIIMFVFGIITFLSMWIVLAIKTKRVQEENASHEKQNQKDSIKSNLDICLKCANEKAIDGFHYHGLLTFDELECFEERLSEDPEPQNCLVLVYTSDLATEKEAEKQVKKNRNVGVKYIVLYFQNSCKIDDIDRIEKIYGKENLINLSTYEKYNNSFDGKLARTLGFDIMIYQNSKGEKSGFFAIDFVPEGSFRRETHTMDCSNKCNFGLEECQKAKLPSFKKVPFYKEIASERVNELYREIISIHKNHIKYQ